jgi:DNA-binding NtrC family response regulator
MTHALLIQDDAETLSDLERIVRSEGYTSVTAESLEQARKLVIQELPDVALVALELPDGSGLDLLDGLDLAAPTELVAVADEPTVAATVEALRAGVYDFLTRPVDAERLAALLRRIAEKHGLGKLRSKLRDELAEAGRFGDLVGASPPMERVYHLVGRVAPSEAAVLVVGETGTGKELVAQTLHRLSPRGDGPFLAVNCGAVSSTLMESELFGHERGSFTGAGRTHKGYFERAARGTLFLDEIAAMPQQLQIELLRVLETKRFSRVGGERPLEADVRIVAASNQPLEDAVEEGRFREDLFFRLHVFPIRLPPLRERGDDVLLLAEHFLQRLNERGGSRKRFGAETLGRLQELPWPGNVRQLKNYIHRLHLLADEEIRLEELPAPAELGGDDEPLAGGAGVGVQVGMSIAQAERKLIEATLEHYEGHKKKTAETLGISLKTLYNRLNRYTSSG